MRVNVAVLLMGMATAQLGGQEAIADPGTSR